MPQGGFEFASESHPPTQTVTYPVTGVRSGLVALKSTGSWPRCPASSALSSRSSKHSALPLRHAPHCTTAANPAAVQPRQARRRRTGAAATRPTCGGSSPVLPPTSAHTPALARRRDARTAVRRAGRRAAATLPRPQQGGAPQRHHRWLQLQTSSHLYGPQSSAGMVFHNCGKSGHGDCSMGRGAGVLDLVVPKFRKCLPHGMPPIG